MYVLKSSLYFYLLLQLRSAGFTAPTPIQAQSWPVALQKRDVVAIAKTGSGKTLGYLLPAFLHLLRIRANSRAGPIILVLAPTRELATQIQDEAVKFGRSSRITSTVRVFPLCRLKQRMFCFLILLVLKMITTGLCFGNKVCVWGGSKGTTITRFGAGC